MKSNIGKLLKESKFKRDYIQKEMGVSRNTISNWSQGKTNPSVDQLFKLAKLLEVKVDDLYEEDEE
ncbi:helix-turn-helix transcriptional regulator [Bacillus sp. ISL-57]|uniref:helix-turn-helix transcriptional regulator n=1 Tax=Bacillus sp. ISL-57 TaxID=2819135 RepID=UPI001BE602B9|nr:helix-turn-helix transcriptional regulator [Bacillus sp. ISL-57]MBT2717957.1 helix-turn-helix transcriptional regulator [Bacillus sp. ISL-57]